MHRDINDSHVYFVMELKINLQLDEELGDILWVEFALDLTQINSQFYYDKYQYFVLKNFVFMRIIYLLIISYLIICIEN